MHVGTLRLVADQQTNVKSDRYEERASGVRRERGIPQAFVVWVNVRECVCRRERERHTQREMGEWGDGGREFTYIFVCVRERLEYRQKKTGG